MAKQKGKKFAKKRIFSPFFWVLGVRDTIPLRHKAVFKEEEQFLNSYVVKGS